ncbi:hypothetical protein OROHE_017886 [Orobanche hederae]
MECTKLYTEAREPKSNGKKRKGGGNGGSFRMADFLLPPYSDYWHNPYQLIHLVDYEHVYFIRYDLACVMGRAVLFEFVAQGVLCLLHLITGDWIMFLLCLPHLHYNITLFTQERYMDELRWQKKVRLYKLGYLVILVAFTVLRMIWNTVDG